MKESALFMPVDNQTWIAWIDSTAYDLHPVVMNVTTNSCSGLALVGRTSKRLYRVIIEADSQRIIANMEVDDSGQKDDGSGLCKVLDEDAYRIDLRRVYDDTN